MTKRYFAATTAWQDIPLSNNRLRIVFTCGREPSYVRNLLMLRALRSIAEAIEITDDRPGSLSIRLLRVLIRLIPALRQPHDLVILGFYSHPLVPLVRRLTSAPILFDAFVSTWDTLSFDRSLFPPASIRGRLARWVDATACHVADRVLLDTRAHTRYFSEALGVPATKMDYWYVGCDEAVFRPTPMPHHQIGPVTVLFYGTYQPLHGADIIVRSAALLKDDPNIRFTLIGTGQTFQQTRQIALDHKLSNVEFLDPLPLATLASKIAASDICLAGPFGDTPKARRVIPTKTSQFLATARPVIAGDSPAHRELLVHGDTAFLCKQGDPRALAHAIRQLASDQRLRTALATGGRRLFEERLSLARLTADLAPIIDRAAHTRAPRDASNRSTQTSQ